MEINGSDCIQVCCQAVNNKDVYISSSVQKAVQEIDQFYNFVDMSMT